QDQVAQNGNVLPSADRRAARRAMRPRMREVLVTRQPVDDDVQEAAKYEAERDRKTQDECMRQIGERGHDALGARQVATARCSSYWLRSILISLDYPFLPYNRRSSATLCPAGLGSRAL